MLMDKNVKKGVLTAEKFQELLRAKKIDLPTITEEEIKGLGKGDGLSATLTILQTTWFIIQFFRRLGQGLVVTNIEWLTVAVAVANGGLHFFWWRKPLDVPFSVPLALRLGAPTPIQDAELVSGEVDICEMPISVELMGHYKLQQLMTGRTWVCLRAIKPHSFNGPDNQNSETMELLDEPDREMPGSEHTGKLVHLTSTWLLSSCSLPPFGKFIGGDPEQWEDLPSLSPSFHILPRRLQEGSMI